MKTKTAIFTSVLAAFLLAAAAGCQREGPAQKAGRHVDRTVAKTGDKFDDAVDKLRK